MLRRRAGLLVARHKHSPPCAFLAFVAHTCSSWQVHAPPNLPHHFPFHLPGPLASPPMQSASRGPTPSSTSLCGATPAPTPMPLWSRCADTTVQRPGFPACIAWITTAMGWLELTTPAAMCTCSPLLAPTSKPSRLQPVRGLSYVHEQRHRITGPASLGGSWRIAAYNASPFYLRLRRFAYTWRSGLPRLLKQTL